MVYLIIGIIFEIGFLASHILFQIDPFFTKWKQMVVKIAVVVCMVVGLGFLITTAVLQNQTTTELDNLKYEIMTTVNDLLQAETEEEYNGYCLKAKEINEHLAYLKIEAQDLTSKYSLRSSAIEFLQYIKYKGAEI